MGRKRKNAKTRLRDGLTEVFASTVIPKLRNRHMLLCPFPLDPMQLYRSLWSDWQWEGLMALEKVEDLLRRNVTMYLRIPLVPEDDPIRSNWICINVTLDKPLPMGGGDYDEIDWTKFTEEETAMVRSWIVDWRKFQQDTDKVETAVSDVVKVCSSLGQVVRLWPDLLGFMRSDQQDAVKSAAARSRYPEAAQEWTWRDGVGKVYTGLNEEFKPERFAALKDVIAEALMLPEYSDLRHVATHGWVPPK